MKRLLKRTVKIALITLLSLFLLFVGCGIIVSVTDETDSSSQDFLEGSSYSEFTEESSQPSEAISSEEEVSSEDVSSEEEILSSEEDIIESSVAESDSSPDVDISSEEDSSEESFDSSAPITEPEQPEIESSFEIRFIDVGQADAALITCDGKAMLIDGGNVGDSSLIYSVLKKNNVNHLNYVIGTHAHEDHIGGLAGALNFATVDTVYCPTDSYNSKAFENFANAVEKQNSSISIPSVGDTFELGSANCKILAVNTDKNDPNNSSIVLRIVYGETSFIFAADAEREVEQAILNSGTNIASTLLKVGHHGSETSTSYVWLREIMPEYAVISVGEDNTYGHPTEEVLSRLRDADVKTFRTDMQGDVVCVSDGKIVTLTATRNADADVFGDIGGNSTQQPEVSEPEVSQPEVSEPEVSEPEVSKPEVSEPEVSEPEVSKPVVSEPEVSEPEVSEPEVSEPEVSEPEVSEPVISEPETSGDIVYITPSGSRYHVDPDCAGENGTKSTLKHAESIGLTPCKTCAKHLIEEEPEVSEPEISEPEVSDDVVYITATGKKYHSTKNCPGLSRAKKIYDSTKSEAKAQGLESCDKCY